jgi:hypothetical protein
MSRWQHAALSGGGDVTGIAGLDGYWVGAGANKIAGCLMELGRKEKTGLLVALGREKLQLDKQQLNLFQK